MVITIKARTFSPEEVSSGHVSIVWKAAYVDAAPLQSYDKNEEKITPKKKNRRTLLVAENEIWLVSDRIHDEPGFRKSDFHICLSGYPKELQILQFLLIP